MSWLHMHTESGECPSEGVGYFSQLELERDWVITQEYKQASPHLVITTFALFPLMILLLTHVQSMQLLFFQSPL